MLRRLFALAGLLALTSCYDSPSDLIGENANTIQKFDSLIVFGGSTFQVVTHGKTATMCRLETRSDLSKPCVSGSELKFERTIWGNYIVQMKDQFGGRYHYGIWLRSDPHPRPCYLWLGEGVVGGSAQLRAMAIINSSSSDWAGFVSQLKNIASEPAINRQQLKAIVKLYEEPVALAADKSKCFGERASLNNSLISIEGDNRHLQPFAPPRMR